MIKLPKVNVTVLDYHYQAKVAVYRHVNTPNEIHVVIQAICPVPPLPIVDDPGGESKVLQGGGPMVSFDISKTYPYQRKP